MTVPRSEPPRHPAITVFLAQENAQQALEAGLTTIRNLNAADGADLAMRDLVNMGKMVGPRMFVSGTALRITRSTAPPAPVGLVDLAPTLASLLGLRTPRLLDGRDRSEMVLRPE